jgi:hypothetical protein
MVVDILGFEKFPTSGKTGQKWGTRLVEAVGEFGP